MTTIEVKSIFEIFLVYNQGFREFRSLPDLEVYLKATEDNT